MAWVEAVILALKFLPLFLINSLKFDAIPIADDLVDYKIIILT